MGSAKALEYLTSLLRVKVIAVLLGPAGVGVIGIYTSMIGLLGTATSLGITSSGVREVALAYSQEDSAAVARTVRILRRTCLATGLLGWLAAISLAQLISEWLFDSSDHVWAIALLGSILLMNSISSGEQSILQGQRRIGDVARISVISMLINTLLTIGLYYWLRMHGIVPVLISTAVVSLSVSFWFARRITIAPLQVSWPESFDKARQLAKLGVAFMISGLLVASVDMATRTLIIREYGIDAAGLYQAAWALSGLFAGFVLSAMGTDFYPRLTGIIHDHVAASEAVNQQTEIGILLALPGMLGTLVYAPWIMQLFYSTSFLPAAEILPWLVLGVFGKVISWPLGFIQQAKGAVRWFIATELLTVTLQMILIAAMIPRFGVIGAAYAYSITYTFYTILMLWAGHKLINFNWSINVATTLIIAIGLITSSWIANAVLESKPSLIAGSVIFIAGASFCITKVLKMLKEK